MSDRGQRSTEVDLQLSGSIPPEAAGGDAAVVQAEPEYPLTIRTAGGSRTRLLLLLLVLAAAAGGYFYFMTAEPPVPAATAPPPSMPNTVTIVPPPRPSAAPSAAPAPAQAVTASPAAPAAAAANPAPPAAATVEGGWQVESGPYRNAAALKAAVARLRELGYDPQISASRTIVAMTRLRVGTYPAGEFREKLAQVRATTPGAFVLRSGDGFTVYAGTYIQPGNIRRETGRLAAAGIPIDTEPVQVSRTFSRIRCTGFADETAAAAAAARVQATGLRAKVLKPR